jgi:chorismate mutase
MLAKRMEVIEKIGAYKKENNITIFQLRRWEQIIKTRNKFGESLGLDKNFIKKILQIIHKESIINQDKIINK